MLFMFIYMVACHTLMGFMEFKEQNKKLRIGNGLFF